jgi:uncharacterized protein YjbI with pentapeptide repeats
MLYITVPWSYANTASDATPPALIPNPLAEEWILERVALGEIANLKDQFPNEADRVISAKFLEKLLTNSLEAVEVHRQGVRITHAVLIEPIDLENAEIPHETWLDNCRFENKVNLSQSRISKSLSFDESSFSTADFNGMKVDYASFFRKASFAGPVDFSGAEIMRNFEADEAQFTNPEQAANFNSVRVGGYATIGKASFAGPVDFSGAEITRNFAADEAQFTSTARRKFNSGLSCQRTSHVGPFERFGQGFVEILNKG